MAVILTLCLLLPSFSSCAVETPQSKRTGSDTSVEEHGKAAPVFVEESPSAMPPVEEPAVKAAPSQAYEALRRESQTQESFRRNWPLAWKIIDVTILPALVGWLVFITWAGLRVPLMGVLLYIAFLLLAAPQILGRGFLEEDKVNSFIFIYALYPPARLVLSTTPPFRRWRKERKERKAKWLTEKIATFTAAPPDEKSFGAPIYPGARFHPKYSAIYTSAENGVAYVFVTDDRLEEVVAFYENQIQRKARWAGRGASYFDSVRLTTLFKGEDEGMVHLIFRGPHPHRRDAHRPPAE